MVDNQGQTALSFPLSSLQVAHSQVQVDQSPDEQILQEVKEAGND